MMQEKVGGNESVLEPITSVQAKRYGYEIEHPDGFVRVKHAFIEEKEILKEARSAEEIREIIRTIESYLVRTKETIERVEKFVQELKQETSKEIGEKEENGKMKDTEKKDFVLKP